MSESFKIHYSKTAPLSLKTLEESYGPSEEDVRYDYNPFRIKQLQNYNPIYSEFFVLNEKNYSRIAFNHKYHIKDLETVVDVESKQELARPIFIKYSPLLDPLRFMIGKFDLSDEKTRTLPGIENKVLPQLSSYNNRSYVDNFFCYLNSQLLNHHGALNCLDYYGSFLGVQERYKMDIADDLEYVSSSSFFKDNLGKHFFVNHDTHQDYKNFGSRGHKMKLNISSDLLTLDAVELDETAAEDLHAEEISELVYENVKKENDGDGASTSSSSNNSELNYSSEDESENEDDESCWETESGSSQEQSTEDEYVSAFINNFPVQMICLEKCDGTLDELFMKNQITEENGAAILIQIIMTLLLFQKCFRFTHNDLHTNNVMYVNTDREFLYYKFDGRVYKVPTYGKIFKIIDFGRAIYKFDGRIFCSDSFAPGGDAATQYNCEPFFNEKKPRLEPNLSFDLARLGTSIYDFIMDDDEDENLDEFQKTIKRWCEDDNGKNVLYKKSGEDRYPNFKLYKMISRTVHKHTPENQLKFKYFSKYITKSKVDQSVGLLDIDALPAYA
jgi:hypothetical protein